MMSSPMRTLPIGFPPGDVLTSARAADYLGISEATLSEWCRSRSVPKIKVSGKITLFSRAALDAWVNQHAVPTE
jgi:excisionase family DNA binding protein